jgi:hypothetical protein
VRPDVQLYALAGRYDFDSAKGHPTLLLTGGQYLLSKATQCCTAMLAPCRIRVAVTLDWSAIRLLVSQARDRLASVSVSITGSRYWPTEYRGGHLAYRGMLLNSTSSTAITRLASSRLNRCWWRSRARIERVNTCRQFAGLRAMSFRPYGKLRIRPSPVPAMRSLAAHERHVEIRFELRDRVHDGHPT